MTLITSAGVNEFSDKVSMLVERLPALLGSVRLTVEAREAAEFELAERDTIIKTMNVTIRDLRERERLLDSRVGALLQENARLEQALSSVGDAVMNSRVVQNALAGLAAKQQAITDQRNGHGEVDAG
jgi:hypothetical protein